MPNAQIGVNTFGTNAILKSISTNAIMWSQGKKPTGKSSTQAAKAESARYSEPYTCEDVPMANNRQEDAQGVGNLPNIEKELHIMSTVEIASKIEELRELESLISEAQSEAEALRDEIKQEMLNRNTEEMEAGQYVVRYTTVLSNRFDTTSFKKLHGELYKAYTKQTTSKRFSISA